VEYVLFNMFFNAAFSFMAGLWIVVCVRAVFRIPPSRGLLFLFTLPFVKVFYDLAVGIPGDSFLWTGINPWDLAGRARWLTISVGAVWFAPAVRLAFFVNEGDGVQFSSSVADFAAGWLTRRFGEGAPRVMLGAALLVSLVLVVWRVAAWVRFERARRRDRAAAGVIVLAPRRVGLRTVDVYVSSGVTASPFTGGVLWPYVCVPREAYEALKPAELDAAIRHELAHVMHWDMLQTLAIRIMGDVFWFFPGYRWLSRHIDRLREVLADRAALSLGVHRGDLAAALLRLRDSGAEFSARAVYSGLVRDGSLVGQRVRALVGGASAGEQASRPPRFGWRYAWVRWVVTLLTTGMVMVSTFGGNLTRPAPDSLSERLSNQLARLLGMHSPGETGGAGQ
jgi:Zn-dependent protease with chaperone function